MEDRIKINFSEYVSKEILNNSINESFNIGTEIAIFNYELERFLLWYEGEIGYDEVIINHLDLMLACWIKLNKIKA